MVAFIHLQYVAHHRIPPIRHLLGKSRIHKHVEPRAEHHPTSREAITQIYSSMWWKRGWVLQEVLLSRTPPLALFAGNVVPLEVITQSGLQFHLANLEQDNLFHSGLADLYELMAGIATLHNHLRDSRENLSLAAALTLSSTRIMSDPRDHVYGVLALVQDSVRSQIVPDYSKSVSHVYSEAMRTLIFCEGLNGFSLALKTRPVPSLQLPSWVCDFSQSVPGTRGYSHPVRGKQVLLEEGDPRVFEITATYLGDIDMVTLEGRANANQFFDFSKWDWPRVDPVKTSGEGYLPETDGIPREDWVYRTSFGHCVRTELRCLPGDECWELDATISPLILSKIQPDADSSNKPSVRWRSIVGLGTELSPYMGRRPLRGAQSYKVMLV